MGDIGTQFLKKKKLNKIVKNKRMKFLKSISELEIRPGHESLAHEIVRPYGMKISRLKSTVAKNSLRWF